MTGYLNFASERPSDLGEVDLVQLVRRSLRLVADELNGVHLTTEIEPAAAPVRGDAARLHQVLLNLILNACQAMPDGGVLRVALDTLDPEYQANVAAIARELGKSRRTIYNWADRILASTTDVLRGIRVGRPSKRERT